MFLQEEIRHLLSKACNKLPSKSQGFCEMIVENYVDELITFLKDNLSPSVICQKLHLCNEHAEKVPAVSKKGTEVNLKDAKVPCNFCLTVLKMIQNNLDSNSTEVCIKKKSKNV